MKLLRMACAWLLLSALGSAEVDPATRSWIEAAERSMDAAYSRRDPAGYTAYLAPDFRAELGAQPLTRKAFVADVATRLRSAPSLSLRSRVSAVKEGGSLLWVWLRSDEEAVYDKGGGPPGLLNPVRTTRVSKQTWKRLGEEWRLSRWEAVPLQTELEDLARLPAGPERVQRLRQKVEAEGWPGLDRAGSEGEAAACAVLLASDSAELLARALELIRPLVKSGDASVIDAARLHDRWLVLSGQPQLYGTQTRSINGKTELLPVAEPARLNERRRGVGLAPLP